MFRFITAQPTMLLLMLVLGSVLLVSSDGFQVVGPVASPRSQDQHYVASRSNLFVAGNTPAAVVRMSSSAADSTSVSNNNNNNNNSNKMAITIRMRKFVLTLWRFLMLPMRLLRTTPTDSSSQEPEAKIITTVLESSSPPLLVEEAPIPVKDLVEEQTTTLESAIITTAGVEPVIVASIPTPKKVVAVNNKAITMTLPKNSGAVRWATATSDLSGEWILMASDGFKQEYDEYLKQLGQPLIVRGMALGIIGLTREVFEQTEEGRTLIIRGTNARGGWERSLVASGVDGTTDTFEPNVMTVVTADDESVQAEAWWEDRGASHISWMRGVSKYGGGDFESKRYLEQNGKVLVCESVFHPRDETRENAKVTWKFLRKGATL